MVKIALTLLPCLLLLAAAGCTEAPDVKLIREFRDYAWSVDRDATLVLPSGAVASVGALKLSREDRVVAPAVVLTWWNHEEPRYFVLPAAIERDLEFLGDLVGGFAEREEWRDDYYLYVELEFPDICTYTYDYERHTLHLPRDQGLLATLIEEFGTLDPSLICEKEGGTEFLLENGLARARHGKLKVDSGVLFGRLRSEKTVSIWNGELQTDPLPQQPR